MRLLDLLAQEHCAHFVDGEGGRLPGAADFGEAIKRCALRFVLGDDVVAAATTLAFADGARLAGCLDLVRFPAHELWIEWSERPRVATLRELAVFGDVADANARRSGLWLQVSNGERRADCRSFWSDDDDCAWLSPLILTIDLKRAARGGSELAGFLQGEPAELVMPDEPAIDEVLAYCQIRLDERWHAHYRATAPGRDALASFVRMACGGLGFDGPMLLAFLLLLDARDAVKRCPSDLTRLNTARRRAGRRALLDHIEVHSQLPSAASMSQSSDALPCGRQSPRLHHVRGHLVRRGTRVFWRTPHLRGSAIRGVVRSRTVALSFPDAHSPRRSADA